MIYTDFKGERLSLIGMGGMRFPTDASGSVDLEKTEEILDLCMLNGINYYDSAWFYHNGKSEETFGKILSKYKRDSFNFATKMPWHGFDSRDGVEKIFETQLERSGMGYFDFYLFHNVNESNIDTFTSDEIGVFEYLVKQKQKGRIRHLGFSTHGKLDTMRRFIEKYRSQLEFCQIQLNWLDWKLQNAREKADLLREWELPIWVMEPLRGGKLAMLSAEDSKVLKAFRPEESAASMSFRFLQSIEGVQMILSGMADVEKVKENVRTFCESKPLSDEEWQAFEKIADRILEKKTLTCTGCKYCVEGCPSSLDIPKLLSLYNNMCLIKNEPSLEKVKAETQNLPFECILCTQCESKCPQEIKISEIMKDFSLRLNKD